MVDADGLYPPAHAVIAAWADELGGSHALSSGADAAQWWWDFSRWINDQPFDRPEFTWFNGNNAFGEDGHFRPSFDEAGWQVVRSWGETRAISFDSALRQLRELHNPTGSNY